MHVAAGGSNGAQNRRSRPEKQTSVPFGPNPDKWSANGPLTVDSLLSRECHLRRAAREVVDLVFSSSTPRTTTRRSRFSRSRSTTCRTRVRRSRSLVVLCALGSFREFPISSSMYGMSNSVEFPSRTTRARRNGEHDADALCPVARSTVSGPFVTIWCKRYGGLFSGPRSPIFSTVCSGSVS